MLRDRSDHVRNPAGLTSQWHCRTWDGIPSYDTENTDVGNGGSFPTSNGPLGVVH